MSTIAGKMVRWFGHRARPNGRVGGRPRRANRSLRLRDMIGRACTLLRDCRRRKPKQERGGVQAVKGLGEP